MKKLFVILVVLVTVSGCTSSSKQFSDYLTKHNFNEQHIIDPETGQVKIHASIDSLYDYSKVVELCDTADVTFHISKGSIVVDADCTGAGETLIDIFKKLFARIKF